MFPHHAAPPLTFGNPNPQCRGRGRRGVVGRSLVHKGEPSRLGWCLPNRKPGEPARSLCATRRSQEPRKGLSPEAGHTESRARASGLRTVKRRFLLFARHSVCGSLTAAGTVRRKGCICLGFPLPAPAASPSLRLARHPGVCATQNAGAVQWVCVRPRLSSCVCQTRVAFCLSVTPY